jgi:hypothetical protein
VNEDKLSDRAAVITPNIEQRIEEKICENMDLGEFYGQLWTGL